MTGSGLTEKEGRCRCRCGDGRREAHDLGRTPGKRRGSRQTTSKVSLGGLILFGNIRKVEEPGAVSGLLSPA